MPASLAFVRTPLLKLSVVSSRPAASLVFTLELLRHLVYIVLKKCCREVYRCGRGIQSCITSFIGGSRKATADPERNLWIVHQLRLSYKPLRTCINSEFTKILKECYLACISSLILHFHCLTFLSRYI